MPRNKEETEGLSLLGNKKTVYKDTYAPEVLETFVNKHQGNDYMVTFDCPEFTSLCPITGQPDFAKITINYIPNVKMVESKSLKPVSYTHLVLLCHFSVFASRDNQYRHIEFSV